MFFLTSRIYPHTFIKRTTIAKFILFLSVGEAIFTPLFQVQHKALFLWQAKDKKILRAQNVLTVISVSSLDPSLFLALSLHDTFEKARNPPTTLEVGVVPHPWELQLY